MAQPATQKELNTMLDSSAAEFQVALLDLVRLRIQGKDTRQAVDKLAKLSADTFALADMMGRARMLAEADRLRSRNTLTNRLLTAAGAPLVPGFTHEEALENLITREERLAGATMEEVAEAYTRHGFGLARATDTVVTEKVQTILANIMDGDQSRQLGKSAIERLAFEEAQDWTSAYAETVYRTNMNSAYTAGRIQQTRDEDVAKVIGGLEFVAVMDRDARENHRAADGLIASQFDPIWNDFAPPLGYNCRCSIRMVDRRELEQKGLVEGSTVTRLYPPNFSQAHPDEGFGGRTPANMIYVG